MTALPTTGSFTMVDPSHVAAVGPSAALVYARILWRTTDYGPWRATRAELAAETGLSTGALRTAVDVLRREGWITTERSSTLDATLVWAPILPGQDESADLPPRECESSMTPCSIQQDPPAESATSSSQTPKTYKTKTSAQPVDGELELDVAAPSRALAVVPDLPATDPLEDEFAQFWQRYPRKVGKKAAAAAWRRARKAAPLEVIAAGLMAQLPDLQRREVSKVPHAATWLNQERWADEATHAVQADTGRPRSRNHLLDLDGRGEEALDGLLGREQPFPARPAIGGRS